MDPDFKFGKSLLTKIHRHLMQIIHPRFLTKCYPQLIQMIHLQEDLWKQAFLVLGEDQIPNCISTSILFLAFVGEGSDHICISMDYSPPLISFLISPKGKRGTVRGTDERDGICVFFVAEGRDEVDKWR
ncbi:hypothetical protein L1987_78432 [Smallanthus sonchifolius]|uniref:Uncharacterized protein n=1 Tax=Smallanthus sonchifolius TaxID=185202 RepID=A0ACB8ZCN3_9ASTR|nr:hypothetical protein L1987_78432 [Smallanthus sonchifolius]